jgi:hypothetical protein
MNSYFIRQQYHAGSSDMLYCSNYTIVAWWQLGTCLSSVPQHLLYQRMLSKVVEFSHGFLHHAVDAALHARLGGCRA